MYEDQTYEVILKRMLDRVSSKLDKRASSVIWDALSPAAAEFATLYIDMGTSVDNCYGDTASREYLVRICKDRGISPEKATYAVLKGEFTPTTIDVTGQRFNIGTINYVVTEKISDGVYKVQCETAGTIGNQYLGTMIPMAYIEGLETAELTEVLIPGEDEEDTESLRARYVASFTNNVFGGNRSDYSEKVLAIDGIGAVKVSRVPNGGILPSSFIPSSAVTSWYEGLSGLSDEVQAWLDAVYTAAKNKYLTVGGTVLVTIVDSDDYGPASDELVSTVQETLDPEENAGEGYGLAPIGHVVNVQSAQGVEINVTATIAYNDGYSWSNLGDSITEAVNNYLLELRKSWSSNKNVIVRVSQIESRILGVTGVADVLDTAINTSTRNVELGEYEIPIPGSVSEA